MKNKTIAICASFLIITAAWLPWGTFLYLGNKVVFTGFKHNYGIVPGLIVALSGGITLLLSLIHAKWANLICVFIGAGIAGGSVSLIITLLKRNDSVVGIGLMLMLIAGLSVMITAAIRSKYKTT